MREYLGDYIKGIDKKIKKKNVTEKDIENHLIKIEFFQHERLIHLLVTLFYGIFLFLSVIVFTQIWIFVIVIYIALIFLLFYVRHYFFLENNVQYLYKQYDQMQNIIQGNTK